ncbi:regulator of G-protein signaling 4-like isoform X2 [Takifugu flavidus]|uniref:regulator of G-protein signaling 4-like isoform X2 n=1 Tax=Takifugu flavidus TaxID=433684 RepID=UPI0025444EBE|nr:regulator of G-protein signaling 4-like isoform X2 [Takifugu flavidus]XP_056894564.1 regulator of G-protein signaling 4-like isoform X2 [Takifugu flavidus]
MAHIDDVVAWGESLDLLLECKSQLLFEEFLRTEYSEENLLFWLACQDYKKLFSGTEMVAAAKRIYEEFVQVDAPRQRLQNSDRTKKKRERKKQNRNLRSVSQCEAPALPAYPEGIQRPALAGRDVTAPGSDPGELGGNSSVQAHRRGSPVQRSSDMKHDKTFVFSTLWLSKFKDLIQNVTQPKSWKNDHKLQPSLDKILQDKRMLKSFQDFLRSEFSDENVEFWLACEDFRASGSADADLRRNAESIYEKFIQPAACREINIDHRIREEIRKSLETPSTRCFDEAQKQIYLLMERDSCPRFLLSDAYLRLTHASKTLWYI